MTRLNKPPKGWRKRKAIELLRDLVGAAEWLTEYMEAPPSSESDRLAYGYERRRLQMRTTAAKEFLRICAQDEWQKEQLRQAGVAAADTARKSAS